MMKVHPAPAPAPPPPILHIISTLRLQKHFFIIKREIFSLQIYSTLLPYQCCQEAIIYIIFTDTLLQTIRYYINKLLSYAAVYTAYTNTHYLMHA